MALLAEEVVQEWLNRQGFFTIRGVRIGNAEIDLLAIKTNEDGTIERRHIEVQSSSNPIGYLSTGNAKRMTEEELGEATSKWITKKFDEPRKRDLLKSLAGEPWSRELVCNKLCHDDAERSALTDRGISIIDLRTILDDLRNREMLIKKASGADLIELINCGL